MQIEMRREARPMRTRSDTWMIHLGTVLALACALLSTDARAVNRIYDFGLKQVWSECAAPGRFNVRLQFNPVPDATSYAVASGNHCQLRNVVCGINGGCGAVTCSGSKPCELVVGQCEQGRGGSWVRIVSPGRYQNATILAPRRCQ